MNTKSLSSSFFNSISDESQNICTNIIEIGLDSLIENGIWKDIPFLSTAVSLYKIGNTIKERHDLKKLATFLKEFNEGYADNESLQKRIKKIEEESNLRNQELEYCIVLIDRYISFDKARKLAKLYLSYLNGVITWSEFAEFSEILDRLLPSDFEWMFEFMCHGGIHKKDFPNSDFSPVLRLQSLGLVISQTDLLWGEIEENEKVFNFYATNTGKKFYRIFETELRQLKKTTSN